MMAGEVMAYRTERNSSKFPTLPDLPLEFHCHGV